MNTSGTLAVSNLGWLDAGRIWSYLLGEPQPRLVHVSEAKSLYLAPGTDDYFAAVHEFEGRRVCCVTAHSYGNIGETVARIEFDVSEVLNNPSEMALSKFAGDSSVWSSLPRAYVVHAKEEPFLLLVEPDRKIVNLQSLPWYRKFYDVVYQGIVGVTEVSDSSRVIISLQRDSEPVLYDKVSGKVVGKLKLAGRSGNPELFFRRKAPELWASDYDTMVKLDSRTWNVLGALKLQEPKDGMAALNIGKYCFDADEKTCVVARPHNGDVVGIDSSDLRITHHAKVEGQPLDVGLLRDNHLVIRDWTTGRLEQGILRAI